MLKVQKRLICKANKQETKGKRRKLRKDTVRNLRKDTVHRYLKKYLGMKAVKRKRKSPVTKEQQQKRLKFEKSHKHLS